MQNIIDSSLKLIEAELCKLNIGGGKPAELYQPMDYMMNMGGKRIRPLLTVLSYHIFVNENKRNISEPIPLALAVEIFHNFTLAHDDVMDNAPERRGKPTLHKLHGINTAILAGDALFALAYSELLKLHNHTRFFEMGKLFQNVVLGVCEGQMLDLEQAKDSNIPFEQYYEMIRKKTAILLGGAMGLGALTADADTENVEKIIQFAEKIGLAFQLRDDYLDLYGDSAKFGKQIGGDILENKNNYFWIYAIQKANEEQLKVLWHWRKETNNPIQKVKEIKFIYDELCLESEILELENNTFLSGMQLIDLFPQNEYLLVLKNLLQNLREREN